MCVSIRLVEIIEEFLDLRGHQDLPLHARPFRSRIRFKNILNIAVRPLTEWRCAKIIMRDRDADAEDPHALPARG